MLPSNLRILEWNLQDTSTFSFSTVQCILVSQFFSISFDVKYWKYLVLSLSASWFNRSFNFFQISFWWSQRVFFVWCRAQVKMCILSCFWTIDLNIHKKRLLIIKINDNFLFITTFYQGIYSPSHVKMHFTQTHGNLFFWCWLNGFKTRSLIGNSIILIYHELYSQYSLIKAFVANFHIYWYISTFLLFVVSLMLSLNGRSTCIFGLHFTFRLTGLSVMVEIEDDECQNSQTFWRVDNGVSFLPHLLLSNKLIWSFSFISQS